MKFNIVLIIPILLSLVAVVVNTSASPAKGSTKASLKKKPCLKHCGDIYKPICAGDGSGKNNKSFGSDCVLANHNCEQETGI